MAAIFIAASFAAAPASDNDPAAGRGLGAEGTGIPDTGWYDDEAVSFILADADELAGLAQIVNGKAAGIEKDGFLGKTITLSDDIDLSMYGSSFNDGKGWIHIGDQYADSFKGTFDGSGKMITGLFIDAADGADSFYVGLFGVVTDGMIKNVNVADADITGGDYVGGIAGYISNGAEIINCRSAGIIAGEKYVGGITGGNGIGSTVANCYSGCDVSGNKFIGGITGMDSDTGMTANCYSTGSVSGSNSVGGIAGIVNGGEVVNCAALNPKVTGTENVGRVAGLVNTNGVCTDNVAFRGMTKIPRSGGNNGILINTASISGDGTLGGRFTETNGWTTEDGELPGLFGTTEEMPEHILSGGSGGIDPFIVVFLGIAALAAVICIVTVLVIKKK
ncbi:MAG: hypothetical protein LBH69_00335 [Methanomassiliicoccaceae archaeon]|jgi:hypothetical protein|nr:hypothetical protein [Methanomassiliicoccaceae archaeon]